MAPVAPKRALLLGVAALFLGIGSSAWADAAAGTYDRARETKNNLLKSRDRHLDSSKSEARAPNPKYERMRNRERERDERRKAFLAEEQRHETGFTESMLDSVAKLVRDPLDPLKLDLEFVADKAMSDAERAEKLSASLAAMMEHVQALTEKVRLLEESITERMVEESAMLSKETEMLQGIVDAAVREYKEKSHSIHEEVHSKLESSIDTHRNHVKAQLDPLKQGSSGWLLPFVMLCILFAIISVGIFRYHRMLQKKHVL